MFGGINWDAVRTVHPLKIRTLRGPQRRMSLFPTPIQPNPPRFESSLFPSYLPPVSTIIATSPVSLNSTRSFPLDLPNLRLTFFTFMKS